MRNVKFYADIHCILDTARALAEHLNPAIVEDHDTYANRPDNRFEGILPNHVFDNAYESLETHISIRECYATQYVYMLRDYIREYRRINANSPEPLSFSLVINVSPLSEATKDIEVLMAKLCEVLHITEVSAIQYEPKLVTRDYLKNFHRVAIYNFDAWLNLHVTQLTLQPLVEVEFTVPLIKKAELSGGNVEDAVAKVENFLRPILDITFLPLRLFSADLPSNANTHSPT